MILRQIAHARAGDKGNLSNIAVFVYKEADYPFLIQYLTCERVRSHFGDMVRGTIVRYELPKVSGLNFVMYDALAGGVTRSLALDAHGKCFSSILLSIELPD